MGEKDPSVIVPVVPTLFPQGVVVVEYQSRLGLPVHRDPSIHWGLENILDKMRRRQLPPSLRLAMDGLVHGQRQALLMEPLKHLPHTPQLATFPQHNSRGVKEANLAVLRLTNMTGILVETEFLTNPTQLRFLADAENQHLLAVAIAAGIEANPEG